MNSPKKTKRKLLDKLRDRYRLVILNEDTLEDVWYAVLSRINFMAWLGLIGVFLVITGIVLVSFTPLREYIPGYPDGNIRWLYMQNAMTVDSLEQQLAVRDRYIENIRAILKGKPTDKYMETVDTAKAPDIKFNKKAKFDSVLSQQIKEEELYNVTSSDRVRQVQDDFEIQKVHFFAPLKGSVTNVYNAHGDHYGVDIVSNLNEPILSVLSGTVIMAGWTVETGYIIEVQHKNNLISIYKHNSRLLKQIGDRVEAGEAIAIIGNTGKYTTGPHLHFELWHDGKPLNPSDYIIF